MTLWRRRGSPPRCIALEALQGEARGRFVPSRLIVPGWRYGSGQMPASSTRHPSEWADTAIYWSAYTYKIFARICNAWRDIPAAQEGNHGVQCAADVNPHPEPKNCKILDKQPTSQIFTKLFPVPAAQWWKTTTVLCELVFVLNLL